MSTTLNGFQGLTSDLYGAVTPSDTVDFTNGLSRWIFVGGAGTVVAVMQDSTTATFTGVAASTLLPIRCKRINSTGTTATNIVALF